LFPLEVDGFANAEAVAVHHGDKESVAEAIARWFFCSFPDALHFFRREILAFTDVCVSRLDGRMGGWLLLRLVGLSPFCLF
jgi:hypothetical protein